MTGRPSSAHEPDRRRAGTASSARLSYVPSSAPTTWLARRRCRDDASLALGSGARVLALPVDPTASPCAASCRPSGGRPGRRAHPVILEKPFGTDLSRPRHWTRAAQRVRRGADLPDRPLPRQGGRAEHPGGSLRQPALRADVVQPSTCDNIQIDVPETLGVENRAKFYEATGAFRDMVVTHLFQALGFVAMEPPAAFTADALQPRSRRCSISASRSIRPDVVRGQYDGYLDADGVAEGSDTETMVAVEAESTTVVGTGCRSTCARQADARGQAGDHRKLQHPPMGMFDGADAPTATSSSSRSGNRVDHRELHVQGTGAVDVARRRSRWTTTTSPELRSPLRAGGLRAPLARRDARRPHAVQPAEGIERLWEVSAPLLDARRPSQPYERAPGGRSRCRRSPVRTDGTCRTRSPARAQLIREHRLRYPPAGSPCQKIELPATEQVGAGITQCDQVVRADAAIDLDPNAVGQSAPSAVERHGHRLG